MTDLGNKNQSAELLKAQAHIWSHILNYISSMSLKCAVELGIPDIIHSHGQPITISELNTALSIHPSKCHCLPRLLRVLIHSGFVAKAKINKNGEEEEGYVLTECSQLLLKDHPLSSAPLLLCINHPVLMDPFHHASSWFHNEDATTFETVHGMTLWDYCGQDHEYSKIFNEDMASDATLVASVLVNECKEIFVGLESLVDVGGGTGTLATAIAQAFPHLDCTVLDLPHVVAGLHPSQNLKFVAGDMFQTVPPADAILLKWVLHDWSDEECLKILKRCKEAIKDKKGGKLIIIDMVIMESQKEIGGDDSIKTQHVFDMLLMMTLPGKERNEKEWAHLFYGAGFSQYRIRPLGLRSIIEVYP